MKIKFAYSTSTDNGPDFCIEGDDDDQTDLVKFILSRAYLESEMTCTLNDLRSLRDLLDDVLADNENLMLCPACKYTSEQARFHGDHKTCRMFPYFQSERAAQPKTEAV